MNKYFGYIEGYYGRELTLLQRLAILTHLHFLSMNTYIYAPKEDPYHRVLWKKNLPSSRQKILKQFIEYGRRIKVEVFPAIAPGLSYDYLLKSDYTILLKKILNYFTLGARTVALLMDDIPEELPASCKSSFSSLGEAHGLLLRKLLTDLKKVTKNAQLWFCPTIYTDQFVTGNAVDCTYIKDLAATIPASVTLMWTGPQVVSEKLNRKNLGSILKLFKGNVVIWDNFYANDYAPLRLFVGPYTGRESSILEAARGLLINPTGLFHTDRFITSLFADFLQNKKASVAGWEKVAKEYNIPKAFQRIRNFFYSPWTTFSKKELSKTSLMKFGNLFDELIVKWQSPLRKEWYPYIQGLQQDINYLKLNKAELKSWLNKRYPPIIAQRMVKR